MKKKGDKRDKKKRNGREKEGKRRIGNKVERR